MGDISPPSRKNWRVRSSTVEVQTTATQLLRSNPDRIAVIFTNLGANDVSVDNTNGVTTAVGIPLDGNGGILNFKEIDEKTMPSLEWWGIAGAAQNIRIKEIIRLHKSNGEIV